MFGHDQSIIKLSLDNRGASFER